MVLNRRLPVDDIDVGSRLPHTPDDRARARSMSPVKSRKVVSPTSPSSLSVFADDTFASSSMSQEQLLRLRKSPISKKLHINMKSYGIPIPFELQLPPRLSSTPVQNHGPSSPPKSPSRLVFNGRSYEAAESDSEQENFLGSPFLASRSSSPVRQRPQDYTFGSPSRANPASPGRANPVTPPRTNPVSPPRSSPGRLVHDKPPSVASGRNKQARFVQKEVASDQLSMIEETSGGSSRNSSAPIENCAKSLPSLPSSELHQTIQTREPAQRTDMQVFGPKNHNQASGSPSSVYNLVSPKRKRLVSALCDNNASALHSASHATYSYATPETNYGSERLTESESESITASELDDESEDSRQNSVEPGIRLATTSPVALHRKAPSATYYSNGEKTRFEKQQPSLPRGMAFNHDLHLAQQQAYTADRRTFSNESGVSSVSSFGSARDVYNLRSPSMPMTMHRAKMAERDMPKSKSTGILDSMRPTDSESESTSEYTEEESSEGSSVTDDGSSISVQSSRPELVKNASAQSLPKKLHLLSDDLVQNRTVSTSTSEESASASEEDLEVTEPIHPVQKSPKFVVTRASSDGLESQTSFDDNNGAGIGFNFPNNDHNCTNSSTVRNKPVSQRRRSRSAYSFRSATGQIEIPDLNDEAEMNRERNSLPSSYTLSSVGTQGVAVNATNFNRNVSGESYDSDSDSSFNSQFRKYQMQTSGPSKIPVSKSQATLSTSSSSPVRHARHRSMYNIDFDYPSVKEPQGHSRSKSGTIADLGRSIESMSLKPMTNVIKPRSKEAPSDNVNDQEHLDIRVAEPPKKVNYAVDFRAASRTEEKENHFASRPNKFYPNSKVASMTSLHTPSDYYSAHSEKASSYNSSRSGHGTASTAPTDTGSVTIDLTKDSYDVCMVKRQDSTLSYRSVIEKTTDGKAVEVVLVDEDEEGGDNTWERDDLSSIYSRYMGDWNGKRSKARLNRTTLSQLARNDSLRSTASDASSASVNSWAASSEANFQVKSFASARREQIYQKAPKKSQPSALTEKAYVPPKPLSGDTVKRTAYYDYGTGENYDFNSFMKNRLGV